MWLRFWVWLTHTIVQSVGGASTFGQCHWHGSVLYCTSQAPLASREEYVHCVRKLCAASPASNTPSRLSSREYWRVLVLYRYYTGTVYNFEVVQYRSPAIVSLAHMNDNVLRSNAQNVNQAAIILPWLVTMVIETLHIMVFMALAFSHDYLL
jgi:hypothetical protein